MAVNTVMGHFYADPFVRVLRHKALPPPGHLARAYDDSGWPVFETACASLAIAHGGALHDLQHELGALGAITNKSRQCERG
eukprot:5494512-Prymnesium_polylepis.1